MSNTAEKILWTEADEEALAALEVKKREARKQMVDDLEKKLGAFPFHLEFDVIHEIQDLIDNHRIDEFVAALSPYMKTYKLVERVIK